MNLILLGKNIILDSFKVQNGLMSIQEKDWLILRKYVNGGSKFLMIRMDLIHVEFI